MEPQRKEAARRVRHRETEGNTEHTPGSFALPEGEAGLNSKVKSGIQSSEILNLSSPLEPEIQGEKKAQERKGCV